jgi:dipeptidyl-peptidase-4
MKRSFLFLAAGLLSLAVSAAPKPKEKSSSAGNGKLDLKQIWASPTFYPKGVYGIQMLSDGTFARQGQDKAGNAIIVRHSFEKEAALDTLFKTSFVPSLPQGFALEGYEVSANKNYLLLQTNSTAIYRHSKQAQFYIYSIKKNKIKSVFGGKPVMYATFSPDENKVAFVYQNDLYIQYFKTDSTVRITRDGSVNHIINGATDWVYEEEFSMSRGFEWSPAGDKLAYYRFDESKVKQYQLTEYDSLYPSHYRYKYPTAGEDNSTVSVWVVSLSPRRHTMKLDLGEENDQYLPRIKWTQDDNVLSIQRLNRMQNHWELLTATISSGNIKTLVSEQSPRYIEITDNLWFLHDGSFMYTSTKGGFNQVYHYDRSGTLIHNLTPYPYDVYDLLGVDEAGGKIFYSAADPSPMVKSVYEENIDGANKKLINEEEKGSNTAQFSSDYRYYIMTSSSVLVPPTVASYKTDGDKLYTLEDNADLKATIKDMEFTPKEYITIKINDTLPLNAWMLKPPHFKKSHKYPVIFCIYGGPGYQTVKNEWGGNNDIWYQYMASQGYIIISVDGRGTGGRGEAFKTVTYRKLGQIESDDVIAAARWVGNLAFVDEKRIGIFGWSFGGYMSAMCLMKGNGVFKTAVSVAPVTDWRYYDNIYTERYMQRPQDNKENYDASSVLTYVPKMQGNLLLIHGSFDDNVHPQNSFMLIKEMIKDNKRFDSEFYPDKNHGIYGGTTRLHLFTRISDYFVNNL